MYAFYDERWKNIWEIYDVGFWGIGGASWNIRKAFL